VIGATDLLLINVKGGGGMRTKRRKNDMMNGLAEEEVQWLQSLGSRNTRRNYKRGWNEFKKFVGKGITFLEVMENGRVSRKRAKKGIS